MIGIVYAQFTASRTQNVTAVIAALGYFAPRIGLKCWYINIGLTFGLIGKIEKAQAVGLRKNSEIKTPALKKTHSQIYNSLP